VDSTVAGHSFPVRIEKCLQSAGITTIDQLAHKTKPDLLRIRNLGNTWIKDIKNVLAYYGFSLKSDNI
jgi:DNA-directed RNA polymerase alpha subunit